MCACIYLFLCTEHAKLLPQTHLQYFLQRISITRRIATAPTTSTTSTTMTATRVLLSSLLFLETGGELVDPPGKRLVGNVLAVGGSVVVGNALVVGGSVVGVIVTATSPATGVRTQRGKTRTQEKVWLSNRGEEG